MIVGGPMTTAMRVLEAASDLSPTGAVRETLLQLAAAALKTKRALSSVTHAPFPNRVGFGDCATGTVERCPA